MLTIVILTKNEQANLPACLAAIPERYPIVIVDSGSTDNTIAIANSRGCRIYTNPWPGFAGQRNFAIKQCAISTPWILFVDADEIYTPSATGYVPRRNVLGISGIVVEFKRSGRVE